MAAGDVNRAELEAGLREGGGHIHQDDLAQAEAGLPHIAQPGLGPKVIDREQKHDVISQSHGVPEKIADLTPRRVGHYPVDGLRPGEEIATSFDLAPADAGGVSG